MLLVKWVLEADGMGVPFLQQTGIWPLLNRWRGYKHAANISDQVYFFSFYQGPRGLPGVPGPQGPTGQDVSKESESLSVYCH